jgi:hypothetical protein
VKKSSDFFFLVVCKTFAGKMTVAEEKSIANNKLIPLKIVVFLFFGGE